jgi:hypothetical protein
MGNEYCEFYECLLGTPGELSEYMNNRESYFAGDSQCVGRLSDEAKALIQKTDLDGIIKLAQKLGEGGCAGDDITILLTRHPTSS